MIEACEESGSYDLPYYVDHLAARIGKPSLVVCLDSGCGDYERLWLTTSLRGIAAGTLTVRVLTEGVHSGDASGIVPSSFRMLRGLLSRLEDEATGEIKLPDLYVQIPPQRIEQAKEAARVLGDGGLRQVPLRRRRRGRWPDDLAELVLNRTWRPQLAVVGMDGYPAPGDAGNVLLPFSTAKLSLRTPPTLDAQSAAQAIEAGAGGRSALRRRGRVRGRRTGRAAGMRRRSRRGSRRRWRRRRRRRSASPPPTWAKAARSPSWACWARSSRTRSSSSPACWGRTPMRTGPTNSCTSRPASASPWRRRA